ncbi:hypothetical protein PIROE2DRAFT_5331, partial [Piromyces sp. E2]
MEKYFVISKHNKSDKYSKEFQVCFPLKRKLDYQEYSNTTVKKNKMENLESNKYYKINKKSEISHSICKAKNNCYLEKKQMNIITKDEIIENMTLAKSNSQEDLSDNVSYSPNDKIENIFQDVYFSDIPCSQISSIIQQEKIYKDDSLKIPKKEILISSYKNDNCTEKDKTKNHMIHTNSIENTSCHIKRISIFNNNENNKYDSSTNKEKDRLTENNSIKEDSRDNSILVSQNNDIEKKNKKRIQSVTEANNNDDNDKSSNFYQNNTSTNAIHRIKHISIFNDDDDNSNNNKKVKKYIQSVTKTNNYDVDNDESSNFYQKNTNTNTLHRIQHISIFNDNDNNNSNKNKNDDGCKNNINNNIMINNNILNDKKEAVKKSQPPPQHIYIQEDKSTKIRIGDQSSGYFVRKTKDINLSESSSNNNNKNNLDKFLIHKKDNTQLNNSKNPPNSKSVYLKK